MSQSRLGSVDQIDQYRVDDVGFLQTVCRVNHVVRDVHPFRKIDADESLEPFATPEPNQLPVREIADDVIRARSNENDILHSRRLFKRLRKCG